MQPSFFLDIGLGGGKEKKKGSEMTSWLSFSELFLIFRAFFLISPEQTVKLVK